jgi:hypothetical protein
MKDIKTNVLTLVDETASGEGAKVDTIGSREHVEGSARFFLNVTGFTGTSADFDVVTTLDGVDFVLGSFTQVTGVTSEVILVNSCPSGVKIEYTCTAVTDLDCVCTCVRF